MWTLGQLIESTGYVVEPYRKYPALLEVLLNFLKTEQSLSIRREVSGSSVLIALQQFSPIIKQCYGFIDFDCIISRDFKENLFLGSSLTDESAIQAFFDLILTLGFD